MLCKRIIPCLDVKNGKVIKGIQFQQHTIVGDIVDLSERYAIEGADELVFYDITASTENRCVDAQWIRRVAECVDIPFCVAGGIRTLNDAEAILNAGADKISINSPALECPDFINQLSKKFGKQCIVIGVDSFSNNNDYFVHQYTGDVKQSFNTKIRTQDWIQEAQERGAGEIVLNCMNQDGVRNGYDIKQLQFMQNYISIPMIASGGAGTMNDFIDVFQKTKTSGALAASVFHKKLLTIPALKQYLKHNNIEVRQ